MTELTVAIGIVAPLYNLGFVAIAVFLFIKLFRSAPKGKREFFSLPWKMIFAVVFVFIVEEVLTVLRAASLINIPVHINGFFELAMISLTIYTLLLQRDHIEKRH